MAARTVLPPGCRCTDTRAAPSRTAMPKPPSSPRAAGCRCMAIWSARPPVMCDSSRCGSRSPRGAIAHQVRVVDPLAAVQREHPADPGERTGDVDRSPGRTTCTADVGSAFSGTSTMAPTREPVQTRFLYDAVAPGQVTQSSGDGLHGPVLGAGDGSRTGRRAGCCVANWGLPAARRRRARRLAVRRR